MADKVLAVIPARYGSTRFPGKPLKLIAGKPMIQWTYEKAVASKVDDAVVATDDQRIFDCVTGFGGKAVMTSPDHPSGTDRIEEAIRGIDCDLVINLQGDEPMLPSEVINELVDRMLERDDVQMGTVAVPVCADSEEASDPNVVKVVLAQDDTALYFSRSTLPYYRNKPENAKVLTHWGIYAYRPQLLKNFVTWEQGALEQSESLEQLRVLENGVKILVIQSDEKCIGVDVPEDLVKVEELLKEQG